MDATEEIKSRLSIEDVVGRYVDLKRSGASLKGLCPFHQEKTPSFIVSPSRGTFHCFGCQRGGDVFTFLMELEHLTFPDALKRLADQAGVDLPERRVDAPSLKAQLQAANAAAATVFTELLLSSPGERARTYLKSRSFGRDAVDLFGLGYAPAGREMVLERLREQGFEDRVLLAAGLAVQDEVGGSLRDRFRARLMFPIRDAGGKVSGFGGRALDDDQQPKYLNSPQTELFDKSAVLFGIHLAADSIRKEGRAVLVEGYLDAVRAQLAGHQNTVASLGTAVTTAQLEILSRSTQTVILALDPDPAGQTAAARTAINALAEATQRRGRQPGSAGALDLLIARLPDQRDPDELVQADPELWTSTLSRAIPAFDFYFEQTLRGLDRSTEAWRQEAIDRLLPLVQRFATSAGWQAIWMQRLSQATGVDVQALARAMPSSRPSSRPHIRPESNGPAKTVPESTTSRALTADPVAEFEEALLALLLQVVVIPRDSGELLGDATFERPEHRALLDAVLAWRTTENYDYEMLRETVPPDLIELADRLHALNAPLPEDGKVTVAVAFHLARIRQYRVLARLERTRQLLDELPLEDRAAALNTIAGLMNEKRTVDEDLNRLSRLALQSTRSGIDQGTIVQDSGKL
jgi:DNA primase